MAKENTSFVGRLIGATIILLASVTLTALILHGWRLHRMNQRGQLLALETIAGLGAGAAAGL